MKIQFKAIMLIVSMLMSSIAIAQTLNNYEASSAKVSKLKMYHDNEEITDVKTILEFKKGAKKDIFWDEGSTDIDIAISEIHMLSHDSAKVVYKDSTAIYEVIKKGDVFILQSPNAMVTARELLDPLLKHKPINYKEGKTPLNKKQYTYQPCIYLTIKKNELHYTMISYRIKTIGKRFSIDNIVGAENNQLNSSGLITLGNNDTEDYFLYQEKLVVFKLIE